MIRRTLESKIKQLAQKFPVIAILGPRQSGKTTLSQQAFPDHKYINLEELDVRRYALEDPRGFLQGILAEKGVILDEIQHAPDLLSYIQAQVDRKKQFGFFILTGSQNLLLNEQINQTLAGRIAITTLLPLSIEELKSSPFIPQEIEHVLFQGFYPSIYNESQTPNDWYGNYIRTYIERDVRLIRNITDLNLFQKFVGLCAGRVGQLLNLTSLGNDCGINAHTAKAWLSLLEASYVIFLLQPYHENFKKRLVKMPKLYFYDSGIACYLLNIRSAGDLETHYLKGELFESMILSELAKQRYHRGLSSNLYFWRDKSGQEVDCILDGTRKKAVEIKSGKTATSSYFSSLVKWNTLSQTPPTDSFVIYGGTENQERSQGTLLGWQNTSLLNTD